MWSTEDKLQMQKMFPEYFQWSNSDFYIYLLVFFLIFNAGIIVFAFKLKDNKDESDDKMKLIGRLINFSTVLMFVSVAMITNRFLLN